jgi:hypothetical protein
LYKAVHKAALSRFMPLVAREALHEIMLANGIYPPKNDVDITQVKENIGWMIDMLINPPLFSDPAAN